jgi:hypothetical protein
MPWHDILPPFRREYSLILDRRRLEALGQLEKELSEEAALLGYSPRFVDRLLAELRRK